MANHTAKTGGLKCIVGYLLAGCVIAGRHIVLRYAFDMVSEEQTPVCRVKTYAALAQTRMREAFETKEPL